LHRTLIGSTATVTHPFTTPGVHYPVVLTVTDEQGPSASTTIIVTVHGTVTVTRELTLHFARSRWTLTEASIGALKGIRPAVLHSAHVTINGYSSDNQHEHAALQLAWNRAHTVGKFLLSGAPKPAGMTVAGHYGHYPASNRTAAGRVANRRVVITWTVSQYR
jgi:flagellar motor protein MotB